MITLKTKQILRDDQLENMSVPNVFFFNIELQDISGQMNVAINHFIILNENFSESFRKYIILLRKLKSSKTDKYESMIQISKIKDSRK